jgi:hypothetical protein
MKRFLIASMAGAVVFAVAFGAAAALNVDGGVIQAGTDDTLTCDADGVHVAGWGLESDTGLVSFVRIGDISSDCSGDAMFVRLYYDGGSLLASGSADPVVVPVTMVSFTPVPAVDIAKIEIFIEGA